MSGATALPMFVYIDYMNAPMLTLLVVVLVVESLGKALDKNHTRMTQTRSCPSSISAYYPLGFGRASQTVTPRPRMRESIRCPKDQVIALLPKEIVEFSADLLRGFCQTHTPAERPFSNYKPQLGAPTRRLSKRITH